MLELAIDPKLENDRFGINDLKPFQRQGQEIVFAQVKQAIQSVQSFTWKDRVSQLSTKLSESKDGLASLGSFELQRGEGFS